MGGLQRTIPGPVPFLILLLFAVHVTANSCPASFTDDYGTEVTFASGTDRTHIAIFPDGFVFASDVKHDVYLYASGGQAIFDGTVAVVTYTPQFRPMNALPPGTTIKYTLLSADLTAKNNVDSIVAGRTVTDGVIFTYLQEDGIALYQSVLAIAGQETFVLFTYLSQYGIGGVLAADQSFAYVSVAGPTCSNIDQPGRFVFQVDVNVPDGFIAPDCNSECPATCTLTGLTVTTFSNDPVPVPKSSSSSVSKGNGSKGKDSKGKDSKGEDSKGKGSKGKDSKGKDSKGKDSKGEGNQKQGKQSGKRISHHGHRGRRDASEDKVVLIETTNAVTDECRFKVELKDNGDLTLYVGVGQRGPGKYAQVYVLDEGSAYGKGKRQRKNDLCEAPGHTEDLGGGHSITFTKNGDKCVIESTGCDYRFQTGPDGFVVELTSDTDPSAMAEGLCVSN